MGWEFCTKGGFLIDPISHALIGSALAAMLPAGTPKVVFWGVILGTEAPDIDFVIRFWAGHAGYLKDHRGPTHGVVSLLGIAGVIAAGLRLLSPATAFWTLFAWTLAGSLTHILSDITNDYGTQALWPFSKRRLAMDLIPIVDVWILGIIATGWVANAVLTVPRQGIFEVVWVVLAAYLLFRRWLHARAISLVCGHFGDQEAVGESAPCGAGWKEERVTVHPTLFSLNAWRYAVKVPGEFLTGTVRVFDKKVSDPARSRNQYDKVVLASLKSQLVGAFAQWTRLPRVEVQQQQGLYQVRWVDVRYDMEGFSPFSAFAWVDQDMKVVDEGLNAQSAKRLDKGFIKRRLLKEMGRE